MPHRAFIFIAILALSACIDNKDYTLDSLTITPTEAIPLASGTVSILDFISDGDSAYLKTYPDGLLYLSYSQTLKSEDIRNKFTIPNNSSTASFDLPAGTLPISSSDTQFATLNKQIDLNLTPQQLSEMLLKTGSLNYTASISLATSPANSLPYEILVTMTDVVDKNLQIPLTFTAGAGVGSKALQNSIMKMDKNRFNIKLDLILKKRSAPVFIQAGTKLNLQLTFAGLDFSYIKGFFGDQAIALPSQAIDMTVFNSSLKKSHVSFAQALVSMSVRNDYGVPCEVTFTTLEARKTGSALAFQISPSSPVLLNSPSVLGTSANTVVTVNNGSSVVNFSPSQLYYSASARINKGLAAGADFMADTSKLRVSLAAEVPLYGYAAGVTMADTLSLDLGSVEQGSVKTAAIKVLSINQMPLDAYVQLYLADKSYHIMDSLFTSNQTYFVRASSVTAAGDLDKATTTDLSLSLSPEKLDKVFGSAYLIIRSRLNTTKDANGSLLNVKFKSSYTLKLNIGLLAKLSITAK
jgi:hypothetical protein